MRLSPDAVKALAPEYVLGTLRGGARRRLEAMLPDNRALAAEVRLWEDALTPIADAVTPLEPPKRVWSNIESRVSSARAAPPASGFWRGFGLVAGGVLFFTRPSSKVSAAEAGLYVGPASCGLVGAF